MQSSTSRDVTLRDRNSRSRGAAFAVKVAILESKTSSTGSEFGLFPKTLGAGVRGSNSANITQQKNGNLRIRDKIVVLSTFQEECVTVSGLIGGETPLELKATVKVFAISRFVCVGKNMPIVLKPTNVIQPMANQPTSGLDGKLVKL